MRAIMSPVVHLSFVTDEESRALGSSKLQSFIWFCVYMYSL